MNEKKKRMRILEGERKENLSMIKKIINKK